MAAVETPALDIDTRASLAVSLFVSDPIGFGGIHMRGRYGPAREALLASITDCIARDAPVRRLPNHTTEDRLLGGLDLATTLASGKPVLQKGLLAEADQGLIVLPMAERTPRSLLSSLLQCFDSQHVQVERDGLSVINPSRFGIVALDESLLDEKGISDALLDRLAFQIDTDDLELAALEAARPSLAEREEFRAATSAVELEPDALRVLTITAAAFGIQSMRATLYASRAARAIAALAGDDSVDEMALTLATQLTLAHRARSLPQMEDEQPPEPEAEHQPEPPNDEPNDEADDTNDERTLEDRVVEAASASIPADLLAQLQASRPMRRRESGKSGQKIRSVQRGRPAGIRSAKPVGGARLNVLATLKAAAPWQRIRGGKRLIILADDFRVTRFKEKTRTTTVFVVDASGSSAMQRLAEVKGAIELMLAQCYVRRDQVALIAFRGSEPETILAPTRSLARAKRELSRLPGGGPTPLASAIDAARELGASLESQGTQAALVFLTDGRGNVGRDGQLGPSDAAEQTLAAAKEFASSGLSALLVDIGRRPRPRCQELAAALQAGYLALPFARAENIADAVMNAQSPRAA